MKSLLVAAVLAAPSSAATIAGPAPEPPATQVEEKAAPAPEKAEAAPAPKAEAKEEPKPEAKAEPKEEAKAEPKAEAKEEPKAEAAKDEKKDEPKVTVTTPKMEETKPLPPAPKKPAAPAFAGVDAEWGFAKSAAEDQDRSMQEAAADSLRLFVRRHPDAPQAPDALLLLAGLNVKNGDWREALAAQLRVIYEYAGASAELRAKSSYLELVEKKASRKQRPVLQGFASGSDSADRPGRLSSIWRKTAEQAPDVMPGPVSEQIREFLVRYPEFPDNDKLQASLARLHAADDKPAAAVVSWRKLLALYPASDMRPEALKAIGDLYADALREPKKAIEAYQELIAGYPDDERVPAALDASARLFEEKLKQYELAIEMDEKIVKGWPKTPASLKALKGVARLQRDKLSKPDDAIKTLLRLSSMHGGQDGVDALLLAAEIARRDLKDYAREAALRQQVASDYPTAREAAEALYDAGGVFESDLKDNAKAIETYKQAASKFPAEKYGKKSAARAEKLAAAK